MGFNNKLVLTQFLDLLLYMESGYVLPKLCKTPIVNRYIFDILIRKMSDNKTSIKYDAAGPFQVTNIFVKEYLHDSDTDESTDALQLLVDVHENFSQIPLYQIQSVCGFLNRRQVIKDHTSADESRRRFIDTYKVYFGGSVPQHIQRIDQYIEDYFSMNKLYIEEYSENGAWDVD